MSDVEAPVTPVEVEAPVTPVTTEAPAPETPVAEVPVAPVAPKPSRRDARVNELWKENQITKVELEKERQERIKLAGELEKARVASVQKPVRSAYDTDDAYVEAHDKYLEARIDATVASKMQQTAQVSEADKELAQWNQFNQLSQTLDIETYSDFDDALVKSRNMVYSPDVKSFLQESKLGPQVFYHLTNDPALLDSIGKLPAYKQFKELERIEQQVIKSQSTRKVSAAPEPISPVGANNASVKKDYSEMDYDEFVAARRAEIIAKQKLGG